MENKEKINYIYIGSECDIDLKNKKDILKKIKFMMNENSFENFKWRGRNYEIRRN